MPMEETGPDDNGAESGSGVRASGEAAEEEMRTTAAGKEMGGNEDYRRHYPFSGSSQSFGPQPAGNL